MREVENYTVVAQIGNLWHTVLTLQVVEFSFNTSHHFPPHGRYELNKLTSLLMCGFIAQLVEHHTGISEVMGSNPVEALIFCRLLLSNCSNWKIKRDDHSPLITQAVKPGFSFRLSFFFFFFFRVQSQIAVWPLERMRHLCSDRHGSFTEVVVA